jgi:deaminated glutathione amidase
VRAAAIQMTSTRDVRANLAEAGRLIGAAVEEGAELVVLPENFSFLGATDAERIAAAEPFGRGAAQDFLAEQAAKGGIWLVGGTIPIRDRDEPGERASSRSLLFDPDGRRAAHYDKIHLFDVDIPGRAAERYTESSTTAPGTRVVTASTPTARIGMTVCYDIRFPGASLAWTSW